MDANSTGAFVIEALPLKRLPELLFDVLLLLKKSVESQLGKIAIFEIKDNWPSVSSDF